GLIMGHRRLVIALLAVITAALGTFAARIEFDNSIESYFLENDLRDYHRFLDEFGTDEFVVVAFGGEDVFSVENFALIDALSRGLEELPHVRRVISLTTAQVVSGRGDSVDFGDLAADLPRTHEELAEIRSRVFADPILPGTLVSPDGRNTAVAAEIDHIIGEFDYKVELLEEIRTLLALLGAQTGKTFSMGGTAVLDDAVFRYTERDQMLFFPVMIVLIVGVMYGMFGRVTTAFLPLLVVLISVIWTYGVMSLLGYKINIISTILGPLLMAVGIADSMHFIADYAQEASRRDATALESVRCSFRSVLGPCVMTSVTTILGLLALQSADLVPIRQFGLVAAVGVFSALVVTVLLLPILLAALPVSRVVDSGRIRSGRASALLSWLGAWHRGRAAIVLVACLVAAGPAAFSLRHLTVGTNSLDYFRERDLVRADTEWIDAKIGGTTSLEFLIEADAQDAFTEPALLERIESFQAYLRGVPGITKVFSAADLVKTLNRAFHGGREQSFRIPGSSALIAQELVVVDGTEDLDALLSRDRSRARITARVAMDASRELAHDMPEVEARMRQIFGDAATVTPTGIIYLMHRMEAYLLSSQVKSFLLAFVVVTVVTALALRSLTLGALAMIPNLLPILFVLALMSLLDIPLDVGTVMLAGVALGLVVDDTIHFLYRFKEQRREARDPREAIARAMSLSGRPIVFTSLVLALGFSVLVLASFNPVTNFGILAGAVIVLALIFDLVVLPALLGFLRAGL
ncbi:MAG: RND family transporter, partial [Myxococcota bacterium]